MDQIKTGSLIRTLRCRQGLTQLALAQRIGISDKAVSKWERGCGAPDISLLPALAQALRVDMQALVQGSLPQQERSGGSLKTLRFFVCPACGNLLFSLHGGRLSCYGAPLEPLTPRSPTRPTGCPSGSATANGISPGPTKCSGSIFFPLRPLPPATRWS